MRCLDVCVCVRLIHAMSRLSLSLSLSLCACMRAAACARVRCRVRDGVRVRGEQCVYSSGAHRISMRMMRMCALECVRVRARTRERLCACL